MKSRSELEKSVALLVLAAGIVFASSCKKHSTQSAERPVAQTAAVSSPGASAPILAPAPKRIGSPSTQENPFDRYLANEMNNWPEPALVRFATACGIDVDRATPRFAQQPGEKWILVPDLKRAMDDQETDFYHTLAVWRSGDQIVTEEWGMELDTGDYYRMFVCLDHEKVTSAESVSWSIGETDSPGQAQNWGYDVQWAIGPKGEAVAVSKRFVDLREKPIADPVLDAETRRGLEAEAFGMRMWSDLRYPSAMLQ